MGGDGPRIFRLCSDPGSCLNSLHALGRAITHCISLRIEPSDGTSYGFPISFPVLPKPEDPMHFALLRSWLSWCNNCHDCNEHNPKSITAMPTRLLYVGDLILDSLRLHCPKKNDRIRYIALSHCWGELSDDHKRQFCTTDDNINARLKEFSFSKLPKTFQDAVQVTRQLGIDYLWIDSLCIIQWNKEDWQRESRRMEDVFASAYCTIAAATAVNSNAGFLSREARSECVLV